MSTRGKENRGARSTLAHSQDHAAVTLLESTIQSVGDGVIITDVQGRIQLLNLAAERLIGIENAAAEGRPLLDILRLKEKYGDTITGDLIELAIISESTVSLGKDLVLISHNGQLKQVEGEICARIGVGSTTGAVVTFRDVTARNWEELQRREEQKMRVVAQLAGSVAHELNNCLTVILGHSEVLDEKYSGIPSLRTHTAAIQNAVGAITVVTRQLLTLSNREIRAAAPINLNLLLEKAAPRLRQLLSVSTELHMSLEPGLRNILLDAIQMEQALSDLVRHANHRMPAGGKIQLATVNSVVDENCRARHLSHYVQLTIQDSGPSLRGLSDEEIFEPTWNRDSNKLSGLGLFTVRSLVSAANGHLFIDRESEAGAKFVLQFPCIEEEEDVISCAPDVPMKSREQETILLVEDDDGIRILLRNSLEKEGYRVIEARDGAEAILQTEMHDGAIDMLISDVVMPNIDGPTLARKLSITYPHAKVLLISGCPVETADVRRLVHHGASYVVKPFTQRQLLTHVKAILCSGRK